MNKSQARDIGGIRDNRDNRDIRGFTLVEMVISITILGIVSATVAGFVGPTIRGYVDTERRAEMSDAADTSLRRIATDIKKALPNSLRGPSIASNSCFEFIPTIGGGGYRAVTSNAGAGDILDFTTTDISFDYLAGNVPVPSVTGSRIVIWNMGNRGPVTPAADAYVGDNAAAIASATATTVTLSAAKRFPYESPDHRFFVIPSNATVYSCTGGATGRLIQTTRAISATPMSACPAAGTLVVDNVDCTTSRFDFTADALSNFGLLSMSLVVSDPDTGEKIRMYKEVKVDNVP